MGMACRQEKQDAKKARVLLKMSIKRDSQAYIKLYKAVQWSHFYTQISMGRPLPNCCDLHRISTDAKPARAARITASMLTCSVRCGLACKSHKHNPPEPQTFPKSKHLTEENNVKP